MLPEIVGRRKQLPVFQLVAEHGVGDVVGVKAKRSILISSAPSGNLGSIGQPRFDGLALLQIVARDDEVVDIIFSVPAVFLPPSLPSRMSVLRPASCLKQRSLFPVCRFTPSRFFSAL